MVSPYTDGSAYDLLVESHCFPSIYDDGDDLQLTPATARAAYFQDLAGMDMAGKDARERGDASGQTSASSASSSLSSGLGAEANVSGARATHPGPA